MALVPPPRMYLTRFHGVFAPHSRLRAAVTPALRGVGAPQLVLAADALVVGFAPRDYLMANSTYSLYFQTVPKNERVTIAQADSAASANTTAKSSLESSAAR